MQLLMSPVGRMRFSRRKRPELPPSSVTVTMAARSAMGRSMLACSPVWRMTSSLRPRRSVERPVPPPRATTRKPRERVFGLDVRFFTTAFRISGKKKSQEKDFTQRTPRTQRSQRRKKQDRLKPVPTKTRQKQLVPFQLFAPNYKQAGSAKTQAQLFPKELYHQVGTALADGAIFLRIEQLGEARVFLEERKILVVARVIAVFRAQLDGDLQIGQGGIGFAGEAIERGQRVVNMVGLGGGFAGFIETFASVVPAADVHHGDATLIMLVRGAGILLVRRLHALLGDFQMHARAISEFLAGAFENFFKFLLGASEFLLMKEG